ncbi:MAG: hypothetical protein ICV70_04485 [Jiangellaceae bacterium]|nr:hypothetical protein [Jiangellaceae bacterium]
MARDDDQVWAELVDSFHAAAGDDPPSWPAAEDAALPGSGPDPHAAEREPEEEPPERDEHFVPPPPPPLPRGDGVSRLAWVAVLGGPAFLVLAVAAGWRLPSWVTVGAIAALVGGFGVLIARMRGHDPFDPDDGAVV